MVHATSEDGSLERAATLLERALKSLGRTRTKKSKAQPSPYLRLCDRIAARAAAESLRAPLVCHETHTARARAAARALACARDMQYASHVYGDTPREVPKRLLRNVVACLAAGGGDHAEEALRIYQMCCRAVTEDGDGDFVALPAPDADLCATALAACDVNDPTSAAEVLEPAEAWLGSGADVHHPNIFLALMKFHARGRRVADARRLLFRHAGEVDDDGADADVRTLRRVATAVPRAAGSMYLSACVRDDNLDQAVRYFDAWRGAPGAERPDVVSYNAILYGHSATGDLRRMRVFFDAVPKDVLRVDTFNTLLTGCLAATRPNAISTVLGDTGAKGDDPAQLGADVASIALDEAARYYALMSERGGDCTPDAITHHILAQLHAAAAETMFAAGRDAQRIIRATSRLFDEMEKFGIEPAPAFFEASFRGFAGCHDARGAVALYRSAERAGVNLSSDAYIQLFTAAEYDPVCFAEVAEDIPTNLPYVESGASNDSVKGTSSHGDSSSSQSTSQPVAVSTSSSSLSSPLPPPQSSGATALSAWYSMLIMRHCEVAFPKSASEAALAAEADHAGEAATLAAAAWQRGASLSREASERLMTLYASNGRYEDAIELFDRLQRERAVTSISLLGSLFDAIDTPARRALSDESLISQSPGTAVEQSSDAAPLNINKWHGWERLLHVLTRLNEDAVPGTLTYDAVVAALRLRGKDGLAATVFRLGLKQGAYQCKDLPDRPLWDERQPPAGVECAKLDLHGLVPPTATVALSCWLQWISDSFVTCDDVQQTGCSGEPPSSLLIVTGTAKSRKASSSLEDDPKNETQRYPSGVRTSVLKALDGEMGRPLPHSFPDGNKGAFHVTWSDFAEWANTPEVRFHFFEP